MNTERNLRDVFSDLLTELTALFRNEIRLARAEIAEKIGTMGTAIALVAGGGLVLFGGFLYLLAAAVGGLMLVGLGLGLAALIVAVGSFLVGGIALLIGLGRFKAKNLTPTRTVHQLQRDAAVASYQVRTP